MNTKTFEAIEKLKEVELELHRLKNALEMANKAKDEPVQNQLMALIDENQRLRAELKFNTTTPQRTWVGLTADEMEGLYQLATYMDETDCIHMLMMAEDKLKEKNT